MKMFAGLLLAVMVAAGALGQAVHAERATVAVTFRLHVQGVVAPGTTFWVAYGPLGGKFGILQLHTAGGGRYSTTRRLPEGRTTFAYITGQGVIHVRFGRAPGNPVVTIDQQGPVIVSQRHLPAVQWHSAPVG